MIVPFAAGGTSDVIARTVAEEMGKSLGQPIVIENVAGAGGSTALARAARAEPMVTPLRSAMPAPVPRPTRSIRNCRSRRIPSCRSPWWRRPSASSRCARIFRPRICADFIAYAKKNPGKINLGHAGIGSSNFLICKSFAQAAGIDVTLVGYRGARARADGCDRRPDRRRLRCGGLGVAGDRRQAGQGPRRRLDGAACDLARSADVGGSGPSRIRGAGLERPVRAEGHAAGDHRETERRRRARRWRASRSRSVSAISRRWRPTPTSIRRRCCGNW